MVPPPPDLPVLFFTGICAFLVQFCAFLQILDFWRGVCLEPSPTLPKKRVPHTYQFLLFSLWKNSTLPKRNTVHIQSTFHFRKQNVFKERTLYMCRLFFSKYSVVWRTLNNLLFLINLCPDNLLCFWVAFFLEREPSILLVLFIQLPFSFFWKKNVLHRACFFIWKLFP